MTTSSPTQAFLNWFADLPPSHRSNIAGLVVGYSPFFGSIDLGATDNVSDDFIAAISKYTGSIGKEISVFLALRGAIDFFVMRERSTKKGWDEISAKMEALKSVMQRQDSNSKPHEFLENQKIEMPLRREQWLVTAKKWAALCESLSDDALNEMLAASMRRKPGADS